MSDLQQTPNGLFILFEGVEGSGKSTQAKALKRQLVRRGLPVNAVAEPGSTAVGQTVRRLLKNRLEINLHPVTELFLFAVARTQLVTEIIRPALTQGHIVICDRYTYSTVAYQGYGRGLDMGTISPVNEIATGGLRPDIVFLLDLNVEDGLDRKGMAATKDRFELEDISFHRRVRQGYLEIAEAEPDHWQIIDAGLPKRTISAMIFKRVQSLLRRDTAATQANDAML